MGLSSMYYSETMKNTNGPVSTSITVRVTPRQLEAIDNWRADHPDDKGLSPDRSTIVRAAIDAYLDRPNAEHVQLMLRSAGFGR